MKLLKGSRYYTLSKQVNTLLCIENIKTVWAIDLFLKYFHIHRLLLRRKMVYVPFCQLKKKKKRLDSSSKKTNYNVEFIPHLTTFQKYRLNICLVQKFCKSQQRY